ncbi:MAG: inositol monophosphatase family protein [Candidatus Omnitrophota bacterium]|nr:inositol monophosphatase [Candidatus Omnitrophota bacterium]
MGKESFCDVAFTAARAAGGVHKKYFQGTFDVRTKSSSYDLVTVADIKAERAVVSCIRKYFPDHNFIAEEHVYPKTTSVYTWIIDPLDGTNNFACGIPIFCVSIALMYRGKLVLGVIYDVLRDELFHAYRGRGAYCNGKRISVNGVRHLRQAMLITGFYYDRGNEMRRTLAAVERFLSLQVLGIRRLGSAALDLAYVACGRAAGFWEFELSPWDFCAGILLVEEAGGRTSNQYNKPIPVTEKHFIVASNGKIHNAMMPVINTPARRFL